MNEQLNGFRGTPGPWKWNFARYAGQVSGFHITGPEYDSVYPVCDSGPAYVGINPTEVEANGRLLAKAYELAVFAQRVAETTLAPTADTKASEMAATFVGLKREARALLAQAILDAAEQVLKAPLSPQPASGEGKLFGVMVSDIWAALDAYNEALRSVFQAIQRDAIHDVKGTTAYRVLADRLNDVLQKHHATWLEAKIWANKNIKDTGQ